jgi:protein ImuA
MPIDPQAITSLNLEQLLRRGDIWRGHSGHFVRQPVVDSGHPALNSLLLQGGWPQSCLMELGQAGLGQGEWLLLLPALLQAQGLVVLLNPPAIPFAQGLLQAGVDLERLLVVSAAAKADFVVAWEPNRGLSYTELRKCHLASAEGRGLYWLFRPLARLAQSSPAQLRLRLLQGAQSLSLELLKQKGGHQSCLFRPIELPLPQDWQGFLPHARLGGAPLPEAAPVIPSRPQVP